MPLSYNSYIIITVESFKFGGGAIFVDCWFLAHSYGCKVVSTSVYNYRKIEYSFQFFLWLRMLIRGEGLPTNAMKIEPP